MQKVLDLWDMSHIDKVLLLSILFFIPRVFATNNCTYRPVGEYRFLDGFLFDSQGTLFDANLEDFKKGIINQLQVRDLNSGKAFILKRSLNALPVARDRGFHRLVLRGIENNDRQFYVIDSKGRLLNEFRLPEDDGKQRHGEYYQVKIDELGERVVLSSAKKIMSYDLKRQQWSRLYEVKPGDSGLGWLNARSELVTSILYKNKLVFRESMFIKGEGEEYSLFVLMDLQTQQRIMELKTTSYSSRLIAEHLMVFDEGHQILIWDIETGTTTHIPMDASVNIYSLDFFEGPLNSVGVIDPMAGEIILYNQSGQRLRRFKFRGSSDSMVVEGQRRLFFQSSDGSGTTVFDTRTGAHTDWPDLLGVALNGTERYFANNKVYVNLYSDLNVRSRYLEIDLTMQCLSEEQTAAVLNQKLASPKTTSSLLVPYAIEQKIHGFDRNVLMEKLKATTFEISDVRSYLGLVLATLNADFHESDAWRWYLRMMGDGLKGLPEGRKELILDSIAIRLSERVRHQPEFEQAPISKIANVIVEIVKPIFGWPSNGRTDFTLLQKGKVAVPVIFGSDPIDGDESFLTAFGFYAKALSPLNIEDNKMAPFQYEWHHRGQKWQARGEAQRLSLGKMINHSEGINYQSLWQNKKLTGAILLSSNLLEGFDRLALKMIEYYKQEGFEFGLPQIKWQQQKGDWKEKWKGLYLFPWQSLRLGDAKTWLREKIESGELDYLVKEAHSGGNDEVVWLAKRSYVVRGVKNRPDGHREEIYIVIPEGIDSFMAGREVPVRDSEFGEWLRARERNKGLDLVYINASCWSSQRAKQEIIAARSSLLTEIPTRASTWTFTNKPNNHEKTLIDLLRKGKKYSEMREALESIKDSPNPFIFPDDDLYELTIWQSLHSALDFNVEVKVIK